MAAPRPRPDTTVGLRTADGVDLVAELWPSADRGVGCVVAHGFTMSAANPHVRSICAALQSAGIGVLAPDLRGHGRSGGLGTANLPYAVYNTFFNGQEYGQASAAGVVVVAGSILIGTLALRTVSSLFKDQVR